MIWFSCRQCSKVHGRPETSIGATIFCECGQGIVVPWESTVEAPPTPPPLPDERPLPKLEPVVFESQPSLSPPPLPQGGRRRQRRGQRDPQYCFNHQELAQRGVCADCEERFCAQCLVAFEGNTLCGPCKNYRVRLLQRSMPAPRFAILSVLIALAAGTLAFFLPLAQRGFPWALLLALLPQVVAIVLGVLALRSADSDGSPGGRSWAITGVLSAAVVSSLIVLIALHSPKVWT